MNVSGRSAGDLPGLDIAETRSWQNYLESALRFHATQSRRLRVEHQLSSVDLQVLDILHRTSTGAARMGDLAGTLELTPTHLTKRIRRLTARELVRREPSQEDRRGVLAVITDDGKALSIKATATYADGVQTHLIDPLTRPQVVAMEAHCRRICAADQPGPRRPMDQLPGLDDSEVGCWRQFTDSSRHLLAALNSALMDTHQLTLFDALSLYVLANRGEPTRMSDVAALLILAPSRATQQIGRLEARGLATRGSSPDDWRGVLADITGEGRARAAPAVATYARAIRAHYLDHLSRRQMIALGDNCRRISTSLRAAGRPNNERT